MVHCDKITQKATPFAVLSRFTAQSKVFNKELPLSLFPQLLVLAIAMVAIPA